MRQTDLTPLAQQLRSVLSSLGQSRSASAAQYRRWVPLRVASVHVSTSSGRLITTHAVRCDSDVTADGGLPPRESDHAVTRVSGTGNRPGDTERRFHWTSYRPFDQTTRRAQDHLHQRHAPRENNESPNSATAKGESSPQEYKPTLVNWRDILQNADTSAAVGSLRDRAKELGLIGPPIDVMLRLLRRNDVRPSSLRTLLDHMSTVPQNDRIPKGYRHGFLLILGHARKVWPHALRSIAQQIVYDLRHAIHDDDSPQSSQLLTKYLNECMRIISMPSSIDPFKSVHYQEDANMIILQYMAEHDPPIQVTRKGYRAVVSNALAQRKTLAEQQWAELKALSWPPWKVDRTAVDSDIELDYGTSRARTALQQMYAAGYPPGRWEKHAETLSGWDEDGTPTIQTRAHVSPRYLAEGGEDTPWAARIQSTRTIQEAWACYLSWESENLPHDNSVYLEIIKKLHHERVRASRAAEDNIESQDGDWPVFPGDGIEVQPLPPSTHLYAYTRTPPPTLAGFVSQLRSRKVRLDVECTAFLVSNAPLRLGIRYLRSSGHLCDHLHNLFSSKLSDSVDDIPRLLYLATLRLFANNALKTVPTSKSRPDRRHLKQFSTNSFLFEGRTYKQRACLFHAMALLRRRGEPDPSVAAYLMKMISSAPLAEMLAALCPPDGFGRAPKLSKPVEIALGSVLAYDAAQILFAAMRKSHTELDEVGMHYWLKIVSALVIKTSILDDTTIITRNPYLKRLRSQLVTDSRRHLKKLVDEKSVSRSFWTVIQGTHTSEIKEDNIERPENNKPTDVPDLCVLPSPALLHVYVRALGLLGQYTEMKDLVQWMCDHRETLDQRASLDRQGQKMMRKCIVAIRVFLEGHQYQRYEHGADQAEADNQLEADEDANGDIEENEIGQRESREPADENMVDEVRVCLERTSGWQDWPTDEEVEDYCTYTTH